MERKMESEDWSTKTVITMKELGKMITWMAMANCSTVRDQSSMKGIGKIVSIMDKGIFTIINQTSQMLASKLSKQIQVQYKKNGSLIKEAFFITKNMEKEP